VDHRPGEGRWRAGPAAPILTAVAVPQGGEAKGPEMTFDYDFEVVKRAYAEIARRDREKDARRREMRVPTPATPQVPQAQAEANRAD
jgi:hypothetical protein